MSTWVKHPERDDVMYPVAKEDVQDWIDAGWKKATKADVENHDGQAYVIGENRPELPPSVEHVTTD